MIDPSGNHLVGAALSGAASLAWLFGLLTALPRWRAFGQRADLWWALAFACLATAGAGRAWETWTLRSALAGGSSSAAALLIDAAFLAAGFLALVAYRGRGAAID